MRLPVDPSGFSNVKPQNIDAFLMHVTGEELPPEDACNLCRKARRRPFGLTCVIFREGPVAEHTSGSCANCWYGRQGSLCSLRARVPKADGSSQEGYVIETREAVEVHDDSASSVEDAASVPLFSEAHEHDSTPVPELEPVVSQGVGAVNSVIEETDWEWRCSRMAVTDLLETQRSLLRQQQKITTQLLSLNRELYFRQTGE